MTLDDQIKDVRRKLESLVKRKKSSMATKTITCGHCKEKSKIKDIDLIDVQAYESPHGCTGGDYWYHSEYNYICPHCNVRNRFLFSSNYKIKYEHRKYHSPENYIFNRYRELFKSVTEDSSNRNYNFVNNYYFDKNLTKFLDEDSIKQLEKYYE